MDLVAALTVAVITIPQSIAYALLIGLPAEYGLYSSIIPLFIYGIFGSCKQLSVGPAALMSIIALTGLSQFADANTAEFLSLAVATTAMSGLLLIVLSLFRLGFIINFMSHTVLSGFISAAAILIALSQLKYIFGLIIPRDSSTIAVFKSLFTHIGETNFYALSLSAGAIIIMLILRRINKKIPAALIVTAISLVLVYFFGLEGRGVEVIGELPTGLPTFSMPVFDQDILLKLLPIAFTIALISFIESLAISKFIAANHEDVKVHPNQELMALGLAKVGSSFFQSFPSTGSFTRSAVNDQAGAKTGMSSILAALFVALSLYFLTSLLYYLPKPILGAIVIVSVLKLIDVEEFKYLWRTDRRDFIILVCTFLITFLVGVTVGIFSGILISLILVLYRSTKPNVMVLGKLPDSRHNRSIARFPMAKEYDGVLLIRLDTQLYFANADYFYERIIEELDVRKNIEYVILDAAAMSEIDSTGLHVLDNLLDYLKRRNVTFLITKVKGPVRDMFHKSGLSDKIGADHQFLINNDALAFCRSGKKFTDTEKEYVAQTNIKK